MKPLASYRKETSFRWLNIEIDPTWDSARLREPLLWQNAKGDSAIRIDLHEKVTNELTASRRLALAVIPFVPGFPSTMLYWRL